MTVEIPLSRHVELVDHTRTDLRIVEEFDAPEDFSVPEMCPLMRRVIDWLVTVKLMLAAIAACGTLVVVLPLAVHVLADVQSLPFWEQIVVWAAVAGCGVILALLVRPFCRSAARYLLRLQTPRRRIEALLHERRCAHRDYAARNYASVRAELNETLKKPLDERQKSRLREYGFSENELTMFQGNRVSLVKSSGDADAKRWVEQYKSQILEPLDGLVNKRCERAICNAKAMAAFVPEYDSCGILALSIRLTLDVSDIYDLRASFPDTIRFCLYSLAAALVAADVQTAVDAALDVVAQVPTSPNSPPSPNSGTPPGSNSPQSSSNSSIAQLAAFLAAHPHVAAAIAIAESMAKKAMSGFARRAAAFAVTSVLMKRLTLELRRFVRPLPP